MVNLKKKESRFTLEIIDYGLMKKDLSLISKLRRVQRGTGKMVGTLNYMSLGIMNNYESSQQDDYESLAYTIYELITGKLPWTGKDEKHVKEMK